MPLSLIDHPATRHFFSLLAPEFSAPSRRALMSEIDQASATARLDLSTTLYDTSYVATTADTWTAHDRAFIGMTVQWIGQDLRRQHGTLACKEIKVIKQKTHNKKQMRNAIPKLAIYLFIFFFRRYRLVWQMRGPSLKSIKSLAWGTR